MSTFAKEFKNGFNFEVAESPINSIAPNGETIILKGKKALFNDQTNELLSIRSDHYHVFPNNSLTQLAELAAEKFDLKIKQFLQWKGGKIVGVVFDRPEQPFKIGDWHVNNHLLFLNSHDGSKCLEIGSNNTLLRCTNQFKSIFVEMKFRHNAEIWANVESLESQILGYDNLLNKELSSIERYIGVPIDKSILAEAKELVFKAAANGGKISTALSNKMMRWDNSIAIETNKLGMDVFALWNGATHYTTHNMFENSKNELPIFNLAETINKNVTEFCDILVGN